MRAGRRRSASGANAGGTHGSAASEGTGRGSAAADGGRFEFAFKHWRKHSPDFARQVRQRQQELEAQRRRSEMKKEVERREQASREQAAKARARDRARSQFERRRQQTQNRTDDRRDRHRPPPQPRHPSPDSGAAASRDHQRYHSLEKQWEEFESRFQENNSRPCIRFSDIPWPLNRRDFLLSTFSADEKKVQFRKLFFRWHPDKFQQMYGSKLHPSDRETILRKVTETSQLINSVRAIEISA